ncbi:hypothetical protein AWB81_01887 [Caballeronia arationis]|uniref:hypothetical protein n=1 Tax=Caballeronia arationis TaxID=1777142 RepID=UPI00074B97FF|nr:hypothetical protein [Caballeronia arationis]SAK59736.1 hypothetical protein AWB81_01887 [Caballeronia arationis]
MRRISARTLLGMSTEYLWTALHGDFICVFDDGEIQTNHREVLYSSYAWDLLRDYPQTPIRTKHHVRAVLGDKRLGSNTHLDLIASVVWDVYDVYVGGYAEDGTCVPRADATVTLDMLAKRTYEITNEMYNELSYRLEEYVVSLDITDFIDVLDHPKIIEAKKPLFSVPLDKVTDKMLEDSYQAVGAVIKGGVELKKNPLALAARAGTVKFDQLLQCVSARGRVTEIDSNVFELPILRSYTEGYRNFRDSLVESRSAAKSLIFSKAPLQQAEYFSRRLQLMSMNVQHLHKGDCGSTKYVKWPMRKSDLGRLAGKFYLDEKENKLKIIRKKDDHLIGKTVRLRSVMRCAHPDPVGVCSTCFGELANSVPDFTNIGHMCCMLLTEKSSQSVLSVKHLDSSASIEAIVLRDADKLYLKVGTDDNSYLMADRLKDLPVKLVIAAESAPNLNDVNEIDDPDNLNIARFSELEYVGLLVGEYGKAEGVDILTAVSGRKASMTHSLLHHIRRVGWDLDTDTGNYVIDMRDWDWSLPILALPLKHFNMSDHSRDIAKMLESSVKMMQDRDKNVRPDDALIELYDLVNSKLDVNLTVLDVVLYEAMIVSAEDGDYSLPKPWTDEGLGVMSLSMLSRSLSATMAFEDHREAITDPISFISTNRMDHPFDVALCPREVFEHLERVGA